MTPTAVQTAEDLLHFREPGKTAELVRGVLIVREPPGTGHGARSARLTLRVGAFVEQGGLGEVFAQDTGFKIERDPDTVRARDWVAEIFSPSDWPGEVLEKVGQWLGAGVRLVWVLDQVRRDGRVYRADGTIPTVGPDDELDGEDGLPGFRCPLRDIL